MIDLRDFGGAAIADLLLRATNSEGDVELLETLASAAYERSWEKLHCGGWKDVSPVWRQAFGLASVLQASCLLRRQQSVECLKMLDMVRFNDVCDARHNLILLVLQCLMMAGPLAPPKTHTLIAGVEQQLTDAEQTSV